MKRILVTCQIYIRCFCFILTSSLLFPLSVKATPILSIEVLRIDSDFENVHVLGSFDDGLNTTLFDFINPATVIGSIDPRHIITITLGPIGETIIDAFHIFSRTFGPFTYSPPKRSYTTPDIPISITTNFSLGLYHISIKPEGAKGPKGIPEPSTLLLFCFGLVGLAVLGKCRVGREPCSSVSP